MSKVLVGMSGGVDSAVAAYLLKKAGYEVVGLTLKTWLAAGGEESRCCELDDAAQAADAIGIPYYVVNCITDFKGRIIDNFISEYIAGRTPNPCVICNRYIKWDKMIECAKNMGADYIATGHYANIIKLDNGRYTVKRAEHESKDQTYMLYRLSQMQLAATLMPLGKLSKEEVRNIARSAGIPVADKPDSQEICFVPDGNYGDFIEENYEDEIPKEGNFTDESGNILGRHRGIIHYTPGQRKGLGAFGHPMYVKRIDAEKNEVILTDEGGIYFNKVICTDVNFLGISGLEVGEKLRCYVKIRYHFPPAEAYISSNEEGEVIIDFKNPVKAAAPGQSAVFYDNDDCVIGGGIISEAI